MSAGTPNRKNIRNELALALKGVMTSAQQVYSYQETNFEGQTPIVRILSTTTEKQRLTAAGLRTTFTFTVQSLVLYDKPGDPSYGPSQAEDILDDLQYQLSDWLSDNPKGSWFAVIGWSDQATVLRLEISGEPYLVEMIPLAVEVYG